MNVWNKTGKFAAFSAGPLEFRFRCHRAPVLWRFHKDRGGLRRPRRPGSRSHAQGARHAVFTGDLIPLGVLDAGDHGLYVAGQWQRGTIQFGAPAAGELTVQTPPIMDHADFPSECAALYLGAYRGDVDEGLNGLRRWFFRHKAPANLAMIPASRGPCTAACGGTRPAGEAGRKCSSRP